MVMTTNARRARRQHCSCGGHIGPGEAGGLDHPAATYEEVTHLPIRSEHQPIDRRRDVGQVIDRPHGQIGAPADLEHADVVTPETARPAAGGEGQRVQRREDIGALERAGARCRALGAAQETAARSRWRRRRRPPNPRAHLRW